MRSLVGSFIARHADGREVKLVVYQDWMEFDDIPEKHRLPGLKEIETEKGGRVVPMAGGKFLILDTRETVEGQIIQTPTLSR